MLEELAPDVVFANEDEDRVIGGPLDGSHWIVKRGPAGASFDGEQFAARPRSPPSSTRPEQATPSPQAGSSGAPSWLSRLARGASSSAGSMPARATER